MINLGVHQKGFSLIEVIVSAVILMVSLLGLGTLQSTSMQKNISAINKTHAMESLSFIGDALRSQLAVGQSISNDYSKFSADYWGESNYQPNYKESCDQGCSRTVMTKHMLAAWERLIGERLPRGQGRIEQKTTNSSVDGASISTMYYEVTVMWDDRQLAQSDSGSYATLGTNCSGNPKVDLMCMKTVVLP